MFWQVRAVLEDRPGAMAALAGRCGDHDINILGLQIFPAVGGLVVDEFVLRTPAGWSNARVERLFRSSGAAVTSVDACSARVLEDQPVRYLRAVTVVMENAATLETQLCGLLGAAPLGEGAGPETLVLDDPPGPAVRLCRRTPFTDTETARAAELRRLAVSAGLAPGVRRAAERPVAPESRPTLRRGSVDDVELVVAMHERCSADSLYRRYHAPSPRMSHRLARRLLEPVGGWSIVAQAGNRVVGIGVVAGDGADVGLLVEDGWQRQGLGSTLLDALVTEAARRDIEELTCLALPENGAVASTIHRAGLRARAALVDDVVTFAIPVPVRTMRTAATAR